MKLFDWMLSAIQRDLDERGTDEEDLFAMSLINKIDLEFTIYGRDSVLNCYFGEDIIAAIVPNTKHPYLSTREGVQKLALALLRLADKDEKKTSRSMVH